MNLDILDVVFGASILLWIGALCALIDTLNYI